MNRRIWALALAALATLVWSAGAAFAHAIVSPAVALDKTLQQFTLSVPTEKEGATTTEITLVVPAGFDIDSYEPEPGWRRSAKTMDNGARQVTWKGGSVPTDEDAVFRFNASTSGAKTYTFGVRQTYSSGEVVDWSGPESSDTPAPTLDVVSSVGGGGTSALAIVAVALGALALVVAVAGLLVRGGGGRPLT